MHACHSLTQLGAFLHRKTRRVMPSLFRRRRCAYRAARHDFDAAIRQSERAMQMCMWPFGYAEGVEL